jgi:RNA polymerase sigma factor (sigma-70 family)
VPANDLGTLVRAAANGDATAWEALVARFSGLVWSVARGHGLSRADAEDVYQTVWFRLAEHIDRIKEPDRIGSWLATTARNECLRLFRAGARTSITSDPDTLDSGNRGTASPSPEQLLVESEDAATEVDRLHELWRGFVQLSDRCRRLLRVLMASPPPSYAEAAAALDMPIGSIGPTRARCLAKLRELVTMPGLTERSS